MKLLEQDKDFLQAFVSAYDEYPTYGGRYMRKLVAQKMNTSSQHAAYYLAKFVNLGFAKRMTWGVYAPTGLGREYAKEK